MNTPIDPYLLLSQDGGSPYLDIIAYRRLVGHLLYLIITCPNIAFVAQQLSHFMASHTESHHKATLRVQRYLKCSLQ